MKPVNEVYQKEKLQLFPCHGVLEEAIQSTSGILSFSQTLREISFAFEIWQHAKKKKRRTGIKRPLIILIYYSRVFVKKKDVYSIKNNEYFVFRSKYETLSLPKHV